MNLADVKTGTITYASHSVAAPRDAIRYNAVSNDGQWTAMDVPPLWRPLGQGIADDLIVPGALGSRCILGKFNGVTQIIMALDERFNVGECGA